MGSLRQALCGHRVYLDANIFIYALEGVTPWAESLHDVFTGLEAGDLTAVTSGLSLAERLGDRLQWIGMIWCKSINWR